MKKNAKFIVGIGIILSTIIYLGITGFNQDLSYYLTTEELLQRGDDAFDKRMRVAGQVVIGSIDREAIPMTFEVYQNEAVFAVEYVGDSPVPDTFKDHCQVVVEGQFHKDKVFRADKIQAKCASKYESMVTEAEVKK